MSKRLDDRTEALPAKESVRIVSGQSATAQWAAELKSLDWAISKENQEVVDWEETRSRSVARPADDETKGRKMTSAIPADQAGQRVDERTANKDGSRKETVATYGE